MLLRELGVKLAGIFPGSRDHLRGQKSHDDAVLVGGPDRSIAAQKRRAGALLSAESERAGEQAVDEPLEANGDFVEPPAEVCGDAVDETAAYDSLADRS